MEFAADDPDVIAQDFWAVTLPKLLNGNYVHAASVSAYNIAKSNHCELAVVQERLFQDTLAVHLQKGSPYTKMFSHV